MPTYYLGSSNSGFLDTNPTNLVAAKFLETSTESADTIDFVLSASDFGVVYANTRPRKPGNPDWDTGNWTIEVNVTSGLTRSSGKVRVHRYNNDGVLQESSSYSSSTSFRTTGVKTFTLTSVNWSAGGPLDRIVVEVYVASGTTAGTVTIGTGTTDEEVTSPVTQGIVVMRPTAVVDVVGANPGVTLGNLNVAPDPAVCQVDTPSSTIDLGTLNVSPSPQEVQVVGANAAITLGGVTVNPDPAIAAIVAANPGVTFGALTLNPDPAVVQVGPTQSTVSLGELLVAPDPAVVSVPPPAPAVALGTLQLAVNPSVVQVAGANAAISLGVLSIAPDPAVVSILGADATINLGTMFLNVDPGVVSVDAIAQAITLGTLTVTPDPGIVQVVIPARALEIGTEGLYEMICDVLREQWGTVIEDAETITTQYDNAPPPTLTEGQLWAKLHLHFPGSAHTHFGGETNEHTVSGRMVATIYAPIATGEEDVLQLADTIKDAFRNAQLATSRERAPVVALYGTDLGPGSVEGRYWRQDIAHEVEVFVEKEGV